MSLSTDGPRMTEPANRFLFDTAFDEPNGAADGEEETPTFSEDDLAAARQDGFEAGRQDGMATAQAQIERHVADAITVIRDRLEQLAAERDAVFAEMTESGLAVATAIARKIAPDYCRKNALGEIESLIGECLGGLSEEPRIAIRVADDLLDGVSERLSAIAEQAGFAGNIAILNDPGMDRSDCRVEWAEGGAERSLAQLLQNVDAAVARSLPGGPQPAVLSAETNTIEADGSDDTPPPAESADAAAAAAAGADDENPTADVPSDSAEPADHQAVPAETTAGGEPTADLAAPTEGAPDDSGPSECAPGSPEPDPSVPDDVESPPDDDAAPAPNMDMPPCAAADAEVVGESAPNAERAVPDADQAASDADQAAPDADQAAPDAEISDDYEPSPVDDEAVAAALPQPDGHGEATEIES